ncbi:MAG: tellurite resistance/C4-dicarboxylate transporter family protein [Solirubrobacteraceae bacterium]
MRSLGAWLDECVRGLYPGAFAFVMATGIVSNAFFALDRRVLSDVLLGVNLAAYPVLVVATLLRALRHGRELGRDLVDPRLVFSFFTIVAGSSVLGLQLMLRGDRTAALALWLFALALWILLSYFSFAVLTFRNSEKSGADVVHGGWLIAIVGTESLVLLGARLAPTLGGSEQLAFVASYTLWAVGITLYGIFVTLFSYRIFFLWLDADDMAPLFWVVMGAAAISTNAGSTLILSRPDLPFLQAMRPFMEGTTLILWAWSTWLIPLLVIFGIWRHGVRRVPLTYHPAYWSLVFPLGMYTVATYRFSLATDYSPLRDVARTGVWVAFAAWALTLLGMAVSAWRDVGAHRVASGAAPARS